MIPDTPFADVIGGSRPNPRTVINNPHKNWKPFSIGGKDWLHECLLHWFLTDVCSVCCGLLGLLHQHRGMD
jgi:hypothetical protein